MPICPVCKTNQKNRKGGACPHCGTLVTIRDGKWYSLSDGAPNVELLKYWERKMTERLGERFRVPRKGTRYKREVKFAQALLDESSDDLEVAKEAINILFTDPGFSWKLFSSMLYMNPDWLAAVVMARARVKLRQQAVKAAQERARNFEELDRLWNSNGKE